MQSRILIVEDNLHNIALLKTHLVAAGYVTAVAHDGEECFRKVQEFKPDLILLDIMLPGQDGFEVCRIIKQGKDTQFIPIIMLTALDEADTRIRGLESGADEVLTKPFVPIELLCRVRSLLRLKTLVERQLEFERFQMDMEKLIACEQSKKSILRDCIFAITGGRLEILLEASELSAVLDGCALLFERAIAQPLDVADIRNLVCETAKAHHLSDDRVFDIAVCTSEAVTNALKHGGGGTVAAHKKGDSLYLLVRDSGQGIEFSRLPSSTLMKGFSTKHSLGYGFTLMLEMSDKIYLSTGPEGTTLLLEMALTESSPTQLPLQIPRFSPSGE